MVAVLPRRLMALVGAMPKSGNESLLPFATSCRKIISLQAAFGLNLSKNTHKQVKMSRLLFGSPLAISMPNSDWLVGHHQRTQSQDSKRDVVKCGLEFLICLVVLSVPALGLNSSSCLLGGMHVPSIYPVSPCGCRYWFYPAS